MLIQYEWFFLINKLLSIISSYDFKCKQVLKYVHNNNYYILIYLKRLLPNIQKVWSNNNNNNNNNNNTNDILCKVLSLKLNVLVHGGMIFILIQI